ncbi:hypothetical protein Trydic_g14711 [Trypoxylus dichotomus]
MVLDELIVKLEGMGGGVSVGDGKEVTVLGYADDLILFANDHRGASKQERQLLRTRPAQHRTVEVPTDTRPVRSVEARSEDLYHPRFSDSADDISLSDSRGNGEGICV